MAKRIAVFMGEVYMDFQKDVYRGITKTAAECGLKIDLFSNCGILSANYLQTLGEKNVINIPDYSKYDGFILAPDTLNIRDMYELIIEKIQENSDSPVVCVRREDSRFYNILINNKQMMKDVVKHFVEVHNCKKIYYMSGKKGMKDAEERLFGYLEAMEEYKLPVLEHMIFHGDYWYGHEKEAVDQYLSTDEMPEAIVCANDFMALSLMKEFRKRGYKIPEDIKVSGIDCVNEGLYNSTRLSSVMVDGEKFGKMAVKVMNSLINGQEEASVTYCDTESHFSGSCGCPDPEKSTRALKAYNQALYLRDSIYDDLGASGDFECCETVDEIISYAYNHAKNFDYKHLYLCLCTDEDEENSENSEAYSPQMILEAIYDKENGPTFYHEKFERSEIIPKKYRDEALSLLTFPLHFRGHCMGYYVIETEDAGSLSEGYLMWSHTLCNYIDKVNTYEHNRRLLKYRDESRIDPLTGLYNRRGLNIIIDKKMSTVTEIYKLFIISLDMDGLKGINDKYGHAEGDVAINEIGTILQLISNPEVACGRMGGDEFTICAMGDDDKADRVIEQINKAVNERNKENNTPYELSVSIGYSCYDPVKGISACIKRADELMYEDKVKKHKVRHD